MKNSSQYGYKLKQCVKKRLSTFVYPIFIPKPPESILTHLLVPKNFRIRIVQIWNFSGSRDAKYLAKASLFVLTSASSESFLFTKFEAASININSGSLYIKKFFLSVIKSWYFLCLKFFSKKIFRKWLLFACNTFAWLTGLDVIWVCDGSERCSFMLSRRKIRKIKNADSLSFSYIFLWIEFYRKIW